MAHKVRVADDTEMSEMWICLRWMGIWVEIGR